MRQFASALHSSGNWPFARACELPDGKFYVFHCIFTRGVPKRFDQRLVAGNIPDAVKEFLRQVHPGRIRLKQSGKAAMRLRL